MTDRPAPEGKRLLIELLQEAAQLEHCLLNAYLYAACSLKSTPQEWATVTVDGEEHPNARRAVQFERSRRWKQWILGVSHEEMLHLHYVQCLLRSLGARPCFDLPERGPEGWRFKGWKSSSGGEPVDPDGVTIPVTGLTMDNIRDFVQYESTDALQDVETFGDEAVAVFRDLQRFEQHYFYASVLRYVDDEHRAELIGQLERIYREVPPVPPGPQFQAFAADSLRGLPAGRDVEFQSIGDLYNHAIAPLFEEAFESGWIENDNRDLNNELQNPNYAAEGFLPIGPVHRDKNFEADAAANSHDPLRNYQRVEDIITEIVQEGEGFADFLGQAKRFLDEVGGADGAQAYLAAVLDDQTSPDPTPELVQLGQLVRISHLTRFAVIWAEMDEERELAESVGASFDPVRSPVDVSASATLTKLADQLAQQFNACFLVLLAWLSRIYEVQDWRVDEDERKAIEMLAAWPLMSLSVRPMLELASTVMDQERVDRLFRIEPDYLPGLPLHALQVYELWAAPERSQQVDDEIDYHAMRTLAATANWARSQLAAVEQLDGLDPTTRELISSRLEEISHLDTFKAQFPYRVAGGYSDRMPDLTYRQDHEGSDRFSEGPALPAGANGQSPPLWEDTALLRLRFAGWGLVQLATDPDPPQDEVGCSGTHMLHAADGDKRLDQALVWQVTDPATTIVRGPDALPPVGVRCVDASIVVTDGAGKAGYVPQQQMSSAGAVQTTGMQYSVELTGLNPLWTIPAADLGGEIGIDLLTKDGTRPFLNGYNHVVSQDGEAIDPFVIAVVTRTGSADQDELVTREVFNDGHTFLSMNPLEQLESSRRPVGFGSSASLPDWVLPLLPDDAPAPTNPPAFAGGFLEGRAERLIDALREAVADSPADRGSIDTAVSLAERSRLVSVPRGTTFGWLTAVLHYGHTVSGPKHVGEGAAALIERALEPTGLGGSVLDGVDRSSPNGRWFAKYTLGVMDTDGLRNLVYGELLIPIAVSASGDLELPQRFEFPTGLSQAAVAKVARFDDPFWTDGYHVEGDTRSINVGGRTVTERLTDHGPYGYRYTIDGLPGSCGPVSGTLGVVGSDGDGHGALDWQVDAPADAVTSAVDVLTYVGRTAAQMEAALDRLVSPRRVIRT